MVFNFGGENSWVLITSQNGLSFECTFSLLKMLSPILFDGYWNNVLAGWMIKVNRSFALFDKSFRANKRTHACPIYSSRKWMLVLCCLMKQNCYFQRGVAECRHAATPLSSYSINTTHQGFQKRYITLLYLKGLKSYQQKCKWKVRFTKESGVKCRHLNFDGW